MKNLDEKIKKNLEKVDAGIKYQVARNKTLEFTDKVAIGFYIGILGALIGIIIGYYLLVLGGSAIFFLCLAKIIHLLIKENRLRNKWMKLTSKK